MGNQHVRFGSIEQLKSMVFEARKLIEATGAPLPVVELQGTVKVHGTNAGINISEKKITYQSRERILTTQQDNMGFMEWASHYEEQWRALALWLVDGDFETNLNVIIFGEWCGGGIQKGVAISGLPKMFIIFELRAIYKIAPDRAEGNISFCGKDLEQLEQFLPANTYTVSQFPMYSVECDLNNPYAAQNKIVDLVEAVEKECPVGKYFGVSGVGEGIVFTTEIHGTVFKFKAKGQKHSASNVRVHTAVDLEAFENAKEFVTRYVTTPRLEQGLAYMREMGIETVHKNVGTFLKWINQDIIKEGKLEIEENQLDCKKIAQTAAPVAKAFYFSHVNSIGGD